MACSKNIGKLAYHNFVIGDDYIQIRYNKTKADQDGEKICNKHIYANPLNPLVCPFLAICIWFALETKCLGSITSLFASENVGVNTPGNKDTAALSQLLQNNIEAVGEYIRKNMQIHMDCVKVLGHLQQVERLVNLLLHQLLIDEIGQWERYSMYTGISVNLEITFLEES